MKLLVKIYNHIKYRLKQLSSIAVLPSVFQLFLYIKKIKKSNGKIAIIILYEHIGDIIACEPVSRYLKSSYSSVIWIVNRKYKELPTMFRDVDIILPVGSITEIIYLKALLHNYCVFNLHFDGRYCGKYNLVLHNQNKFYTAHNYFNYGSILETFSEIAGLPRIMEQSLLSLEKEDRFPEINYTFVAVQVESNESCKTWDLEKWEQLIQMNPDLIFVEIGLKSHFSNLPNCNSSYCGKLSLSDIAYLMRKSMLFIGIDSSGAHYANALNIPSIALLGSYHEFSQYNPYAVTPPSFKILYRPNVNDISVDEVQRVVSNLIRN